MLLQGYDLLGRATLKIGSKSRVDGFEMPVDCPEKACI